MSQLELLIFDLDGVITSEARYWNTARLTVWEILTSSDFLGRENFFTVEINSPSQAIVEGKSIISDSFITELKRRAVNSNWDLTYFVVCLYLISILPKVSLKEEIKDLSLQQQLQLIGKTSRDLPLPGIIEQFWQETQLSQGSAVNDYLIPFSKKVIGLDLADLISLEELWELCYNLFQAWYQGKRGYLLPDEETVLEPNKIQETLSTLSQHYDLGIATGRPRQEVIEPLTKLGILKYFNSQRIVTYDEVLEAQKYLQNTLKLGKPHPFIIYKAVYPQLNLQEILQADFTLKNPEKIAYVGDAGSDVVAAKTAKCLSIGVLTGFSTAESLLHLGCDMIVQDITHLIKVLIEV